MSQIIEVTLPDIGDFHDVEVIEILVSTGDSVAKEDSLLTLESDKATMEIPSPQAGVVKEIRIGIGDKINQGDLILLLQAEGAQAPEVAQDSDAGVSEAAVAPEPAAVQETVHEAAASAPAGEPQRMAVTVPDIGDFSDVEVVEVLVADGDSVSADGSLITLETDKATMEIPSPHAGVVRGMQIRVGDRVNQGDPLCDIEVEGAAPAPAEEPAATEAVAPAPAAPAEPAERLPGEKEARRRPVISKPSDAPRGKAHASPAVRRFARELGVDLFHVAGTGPKGRITREDVQGFVKRTLAEGAPEVAASGGALQLPAPPTIDFSQFGEIEEQELGRIKKISGKHLHNAWLGIPHVTQFDEADITDLEGFRKGLKAQAEKEGVKLTFMPFLMKALATALQQYPQFNASLSPDTAKLILKKYFHIGVAVDTPNGLMVPVVRDVEAKGVFDLARDLMDISSRARAGKLAPADMQGGCISISSLGGIGGTQFTPIVNSPEVAILGVSRAEMKPKWNGSEFEPRLMMPFSLSYDHRVIDGAEGVRFTTYLSSLLGDIRRLVL